MGVNAEKLLLIKEYKFPNGMKIESDREFEELLHSRAQSCGISCTITLESIANGVVSSTLNLGGSCKMISPGDRSQKPRSFLGRVLDTALDLYYGNYIITFSYTGAYCFVEVYQYVGNLGEPDRSHWAIIMGDIIDGIFKEQ